MEAAMSFERTTDAVPRRQVLARWLPSAC